MEERIRLGVSACLLGQPVRYDGMGKLDRYITGTLGEYIDFVPVCPEVESGFPVPRETMRLVGDPENPRLLTTRTGVDHTERMLAWAEKRVRELEQENLCGFIFKSDSPSSGLMRVKVYNSKGMAEKKGVGLFARAFTRRFPLLPVEEEGRLNDAKLRETFIEQLFTLKRWRETLAAGRTMKNLVEFHTRHKLLILSHSPAIAKEMGKLVAQGRGMAPTEAFTRYENLLVEALRAKATLKKNLNVLQHIMGYFKQQLSAGEKQELVEILDHYRREIVPLIVPVTLLNHYVRKYDEPYLKQQVYLNPHPIALKLRNHA
ncbi:MAG: DUF523 and DUF1722 domain-containing protein [Desulfobacterales bacterium]|jgi:uncharacterized protein YbgA (DUF1722 family)/uncharacterized protein YbbK (DUF523 family)|nr:DUF523 and DUF1722 domain-containing protein [Desulfobacterales bacterium]